MKNRYAQNLMVSSFASLAQMRGFNRRRCHDPSTIPQLARPWRCPCHCMDIRCAFCSAADGVGVMRGFSSIGLVRPKDAGNIGSVLRAAHCYGASMVAIQGARAPVKHSSDTPKAWRHMPVIRSDDLKDAIPYGAVPVAVDLVEDARCLFSYQHPQSAFYVFGPEDGTLGASILDWCPQRIMVPTRGCMNLAATVNVVLYDRMMKAERMARGMRWRGAA